MVDRRHTSSVKWDMIAKLYGEDVLPLWVADMDFACCPLLVERLRKRVEHPVFGYSFRDDEYYQAIIDWYSRRYGVTILREWIVDGPGVVPMLAFLVNSLTQPGDKIVIQPPVYPPFFHVVSENGRRIVENRLKKIDNFYVMDLEDLESKIDERTKMIIFSNPHNPVGRVWKHEELEKLVELARKHNIVIISDEIHADLVYSKYKFISLLNYEYEKIIVLNSPGKTFNIPGLTNSYGIIRNKYLRNSYKSILNSFELNVANIFGMEALKAAYKECDDWLEKLLKTLEENRDYAVEFIRREMPLLDCTVPEGTYLLWINCSKMNLANPQKFFLEKARVYLNNGRDFGDPNFVRLNFATSMDVLSEALNRMKRAYDEQMQFDVLEFNSNDFEHCLKIREKVFVCEQNISKNVDVDGKDPEALHFLLKHFSNPIATARARKIEQDTYKIERVAVLKDYRGLGYGKIIMKKIEEFLTKQGAKKLVLNSQLTVAGFYEKIGYERVGAPFEEASFMHIRMEKRIKP